jgi:hypothetical protein
LRERADDPLAVDDEGTRITREVAARAILRLRVLEVAMLVGTVFLCLLAGAVLALLLATSLGLSFRTTWAVASLLLFTVPAMVAWRRERRSL